MQLNWQKMESIDLVSSKATTPGLSNEFLKLEIGGLNLSNNIILFTNLNGHQLLG